MLIRFALASLLPLALAGQASAGTLIALDSARNFYTIDASTGAKTLIGTVSTNAGTTAGLARDPATGTIYLTSSSNDSLFTLDISTGVATLVGAYGVTGIVMHGIEWDSSTGTLYGGSGGNLYTINTTTGAATLVGTSGLTSFLNLGYVPTTDTLYATNSSTLSTDSSFIVNRATGAVTLLNVLGAGVTNPNGLAYDSDNDILYLVDNSADGLFTIDQVTGLATLVGSTGSGNLLGLVYIPDPSTGTPYCFGDGTGTACPCANNGAVGNGCANSIIAAGANLTATGTASIGADTLVLNGSGMPNSSVLYFQGTLQLSGGAGVPFGDGLRCVGGPSVRLGIGTNVNNASRYPTVGDPLVSVKGAVAAGDVRNYQVWYRNADAAFCTVATFNLSNGVQITWAP